MREFGKILPRFWTGPTGRILRAAGPETQVAAVYLFSCQASSWIGIYNLALDTVTHETGLTMAAVQSAFEVFERADFAFYDEATEMVWVPSMARVQIGRALTPSDNRHKGMLKDLRAVAHSPFAQRFYEQYKAAFHLPDWWGAASVEAAPAPAAAPTAPLSPPAATGRGARQTRQLTAEPAGFQEWWQRYPRKVAKAAALKSWKALAPSEALQATMHAALDVQRRSPQWMKDGGEFIPHPATWLSHKRWEDELVTALPPQGGPTLPVTWVCRECGEAHETPRSAKGICPKRASA